MKHDHLMGYPYAVGWSVDATEPDLWLIQPYRPYPLGAPNRVMPRVMGVDLAAPALADYLPNDVVQCTAGDLRAIGQNPQIQAARRRGALVDFNDYLLAHRAVCHDTRDC